MNTKRYATAAVILLVTAVYFSTPAFAAKPYSEALAYDFGASRAELVKIEQTIRDASAEDRALIEDRLLTTLDAPKATFACKQWVCRMLRRIGTEKCIDPLTGLLTDNEMSHMARYALQPQTSPQVSAALRAAVPEAKGRTRVGLINELGARADTEAVPMLARYARGRNAEVAGAAIGALGKIGTPEAAVALGRVKPTEAQQSQLNAASLRCADSLVIRGEADQATKIYRKLTATTNPAHVRLAAIRGLAALAPGRSWDLIEPLLDSEDVAMQTAAARMAGQITDANKTKALGGRFSSWPPAVQVVLIDSWAAAKNQSAASIVTRAVTGKDTAVRVAAVKALGTLGDTGSVPVLVEAAKAEDAAGKAAIISLTNLSAEGVDDRIVNLLAKADAAQAVPLIEVATNRQIEDATPVLFKLARHEDSDVRRAAYRGLRDMAARRDLLKILAMLADDKLASDRTIIEQTAAAVAVRYPNWSPEVIRREMRGAPQAAKPHFIAVLAKLGNVESLKYLRLSLASEDVEIRKAAVRGLAAWPKPKPMADLLKAATKDTDNTVKVLALRGYLRLVAMPSERSAKQTAGLLTEAMELATRADEKRMILGQLPGVACPAALKLAEAHVNDPQVGAEAKQAVVQIKKKRR